MNRVGLALVVAAVAAAAAAAPPPIVDWRDAGGRVGDVVTVEGDVVAARTVGDTLTLEFAPDDARAFRVVVLIPMLSDLPRHPEQLYAGRRVRASGRVQRFQGRPEMVLRSGDEIEVVDVAAPAATAAAPPPATTAPVAPPPPSVPAKTIATAAPAPAPAPVAAAPAAPPPPPPVVRQSVSPPQPREVPPVAAPAPPAEEPPAPAPRGLAAAVQRQIAQFDGCEQARARWRTASTDARSRTAALDRCLAGTTYGCRTEAAALAPALSAVEWAAQQVESSCP